MAYFKSGKMIEGIAGRIANRSGKAAYEASIQASKALGHGVGKATAEAVSKSEGAITKAMPRAMTNTRRAYYGGAAAIGLGGATAMRPNSNQSRTAYRGPMQTGRGVGRFA